MRRIAHRIFALLACTQIIIDGVINGFMVGAQHHNREVIRFDLAEAKSRTTQIIITFVRYIIHISTIYIGESFSVPLRGRIGNFTIEHANQILHKIGFRFSDFIAFGRSTSRLTVRFCLFINIIFVVVVVVSITTHTHTCHHHSIFYDVLNARQQNFTGNCLVRFGLVPIKNASHLASFEDYNVDYDEVSTSHQKSIFNATTTNNVPCNLACVCACQCMQRGSAIDPPTRYFVG